MLPDKQEKLFAQWLAQHEALIFKVVKSYAVTPEDRADLLQDILLQLWSSIPNFQGRASETTWIYRLALNTALVWTRSQTRKRKKHRRLIVRFSEAATIQQNPSDSMPNEKILDQLYGAIHRLSKIDGSIVLMHLDGLSYEQMAEILGISKSNVGVKLNRAKKQLAQLLKGLIDDL